MTWAHFDRSELVQSRWGSPGVAEMTALDLLVRYVLDPLREHVGVPVRITSGYRSPRHNAVIGGSPRSQHCRGEAADIKVHGYTAEQVAVIIAQLGLPVDQVIWYDPARGGHVHVSHSAKHNRGQFLRAPDTGGYRPWSP
jgi:uncharacterized protein YcbK (DUF882 family)